MDLRRWERSIKAILPDSGLSLFHCGLLQVERNWGGGKSLRDLAESVPLSTYDSDA